MAIQSSISAAEAQPIDIEAWTEQATASMAAVNISSPGFDRNRTVVTVQIPLDEAPTAEIRSTPLATAQRSGSGYYKRKEPLRRDSLKRREALLMGREGSRRRMRWENDHLLNNPFAEPPEPKDWEVRPSYPVRQVPYYLAALWDAGLERRDNERKKAALNAKVAARTTVNKPSAPGIVPKELREKLKRSRGAKGLLIDLESEVRSFVEAWDQKQQQAKQDGLPTDMDSEDEEIVFIGRNGAMSDAPNPEPASKAKRELMIFETPEEDQGGRFGRWLVHHIGVYYGLKTWSVTAGDPARREAYIGVKESRGRAGCGMPRPLWGLV